MKVNRVVENPCFIEFYDCVCSIDVKLLLICLIKLESPLTSIRGRHNEGANHQNINLNLVGPELYTYHHARTRHSYYRQSAVQHLLHLGI